MTLSGRGQDAFQRAVAVGANGNAIVTWTRSDGSGLRAQAVRSAAGVPGTVKTLSADGSHATDPDDASGDGVISHERSDGNDFRIRARGWGQERPRRGRRFSL